MDQAFHYPPELMSLMIDAISCLFRSKDDVILFFKGAGVPNKLLVDLEKRIAVNRESIRKHEIARTVLTRLNQSGDNMLRQRREVLKRVVEFEDFSTCWPKDQNPARGFVAEIRRVVNVKDSFTRMRIELEEEKAKHQAIIRAEVEKKRQYTESIRKLYKELCALFTIDNPQIRGKAFELFLTSLFKAEDIYIREPFTLCGTYGEGIVEQIDGAISLDGHLYLVEAKWWNTSVGKSVMAEHLVRLFSRADTRGIYISASDFTPAALLQCKEALQSKVIILCTVKEIVRCLEQEASFKTLLKAKITAAELDKQPFHEVVS
jgi:hypothetical protein